MTSKHIFFSGRFGGEKEVVARELHAALRNLGVNAHIVDAGPGRAFGAKTIYGLCHMELMICICYDDYGEKTDSSSCTFYELKHADDHHIPIYYLKMSDIWPPKPPKDFDGGNEGPDQIKFVIKKDDFYHDWNGKEWNAMVCAEEVKQELHKIFREKRLDESILNMNANNLSTLSNSPQVQELTQHTPKPAVDIAEGGTFDERILNGNPNDLSTFSNSPQVQELTQHTPKPVVDTDEEENQPEEMKENKTEEKDQKADDEKENTFIQKRGTQVTILLAIITIIVSIVMVLTLKKLDRKYWGGEACKTNENCFSKRCDLDLNICFCKDEENKDYCRDPTFMCIDKFQCNPMPTAAEPPTPSPSIDESSSDPFFHENPTIKPALSPTQSTWSPPSWTKPTDDECVSPAEHRFTVTIFYDEKPEETSWSLDKMAPYSGNPNLYAHSAEKGRDYPYDWYFCLESGNYVFKIHDNPTGDGICCDFGDGNYTITSNGEVIQAGGKFSGLFEDTQFSLPL